jgi:hypothetical protein
MDMQQHISPMDVEEESSAVTVVELHDAESARPTLTAHLACYGQSPDQGLEVEITHLSEHLLALRSPVALQPGTEYRVQMGTGALAESCGLRVVASRRRPDGLHDIGAVYLKSRLSVAA